MRVREALASHLSCWLKPRHNPVLAVASLAVLAMLSAPSQAETEPEALERARAANGRGDYATSAEIFTTLDKLGSAAGPRNLGLMHYAGAGRPRNVVLACNEFARAEQRGDPVSTELLGDCYFKGEGRARDYQRSAELYILAGVRGVEISFCALGNQYREGLGVAKDPAKAAALCQKSADLGVSDAQTDLGQMYLHGSGVLRDFTQAAFWLQKASDQGQNNARYLLGQQYWNGDGVERDRPRSAALWRAAALERHARAPTRLATYYFLHATNPAERQVNMEIAVKTVYWALVGLQTDPDQAGRERNQSIIDMLLKLAPDLKDRAEALIRAKQPPAE